MGSWKDLPREILVHVFRSYLITENQKRLLRTVAPVCLEWEEACMDSYLWYTFDGHLNFLELKELSLKGYLQHTEILKFSHINDQHSVIEFDEIFSGLPKLKYINVNKIKKSQKNVFQSLMNHCFKLSEIDFSGKFQVHINFEIIQEFLHIRGSALTGINLSNVHLVNAEKCLKNIAACCPNLQQLSLLNIDCNRILFPLFDFQAQCSSLKLLRMGPRVKIQAKNSISFPGFPELEVFSFIIEMEYFGDEQLKKILFNSTKLQYLELQGSSNLSVRSLIQLPANLLENFILTKSNICASQHVYELFTKWHQSLKFIDVSGMKGEFINEAVLGLLPPGSKSSVRGINLSGTQITAFTVKKLIELCDDLQMLRLDSCRKLQRGMKQAFIGKSELQYLLKKISEECADC
ncbi:F-box/LRR-repeat protein 6-like [Stegodyphus dumicola]|uniref:F-box/LRR-repeat protein 6-like n=1 Tax=Stegodyphus dumicola TaxID=202533 RepID=UPI0015B2AC30|nr:F-box/LRR-repeat protein 6-like [Stegodyphus dumicola]